MSQHFDVDISDPDDLTPPEATPVPIPVWGERLTKRVDALHGEMQLLRADVVKKLGTQQKLIGLAKFLGTVAGTALVTLVPELKEPVGKVLSLLLGAF